MTWHNWTTKTLLITYQIVLKMFYLPINKYPIVINEITQF